MTPDVKQLEHLPEEVLAEIVREGETMISSQFQSHLATEQRGFTFAGISLASSSAAFAALVAKRDSGQISWEPMIILFFAIGFLISGTLSIASVWPRPFSIPGNEPQNWLPEHWPTGPRNLKNTRVEQSKVLQSQIFDNRKTAYKKAKLQRASVISAYLTALLSGAAWLVSMLYR